ncbi:uncharacterized protein LOC131954761 [Physella acuta]|uniref:uncharacterized protein LOC131954761 n=1 Tax=Physella acuta TaxID=109671 RepID=UPI0027DBDED0|nr:uncharacterized protein LOC131954761 [Physella acuta]
MATFVLSISRRLASSLRNFLLVLITTELVYWSVLGITLEEGLLKYNAIESNDQPVRTASDNEFLQTYINFLSSKNPGLYIPVAGAGILLGALGNIAYFAFFCNKKKRTFYTRDSLYFRRLAFLDLLVCLFVLPYSIVYEMERVNHNYVCKVLEYVRHFIIYCAHLGLISYGVEFSLRLGYTASRENIQRATAVVITISAMFSIPVLFIYKVEGNNLNKTELVERANNMYLNIEEDVDFTEKYAGLEPGFCHLTFNFDSSSSSYHFIELVRNGYYLTNAIMYGVSVVFYTYQVIRYLDARPSFGRESAYVRSTTTFSHQIQSQSYEDYAKQEVEHAGAGHQRRGSAYQAPIEEEEDDDNNLTQNMLNSEAYWRMCKKKLKIGGTDVDVAYEDFQAGNIEDYCWDFSDLADENNSNVEEPVKGDDDLKVHFNKVVHTNEEETPVDSAKIAAPPVQTRSILKTPVTKTALKISSYKKAFIIFILIDLLIIALAVVWFIATKGESTVLNAIHLKSIISFYFMSLFNRELRRATWGRVCKCCQPSQKDSKSKPTGQEFFGSNVRQELMQKWGRMSMSDFADEESYVSGVSDLPEPKNNAGEAPQQPGVVQEKDYVKREKDVEVV